MSQAIQPLRIQKNPTSSSPNKMNSSFVSRPLAELSPVAQRRNSPSYNLNTKKSLFNGDSSPFDSSPLGSNSPRSYWQNRDSVSPHRFGAENRNPMDGRDGSPSPSKRSSIENLKRASRVKNSNMFAREHKQEYDPTSTPVIERPLASGRPLSTQKSDAIGHKGCDGIPSDGIQGNTKIHVYSPQKSPQKFKATLEPQKSPSREQTSPGKSSLSKNSRYAHAFDPENSMWSEEEESVLERQLPPGKALHRHAKSVTFDAAPPQINEYEMTTPDPSSVASGSREGSYESGDGDEDESFDRSSSVDRDDSFDASLEDTDKTPVVLPEDWRFMSPAIANDDLAATMEDPFDEIQSSPAPTAKPTSSDLRMSPTRTDSINSNGERRPLPPLPALGLPMFPRARSDSNNSLSATAERINNSARNLPSPPRPASISKADLQQMGASSMPLEERLQLMMIQEAEKSRNPAEEQRERRLRRGGGRDKSPEHPEDRDPAVVAPEEDVENDYVADLGDYQMPPRISRESILRKVKSRQFIHDDYEDNSPSPSSSPGRDAINGLDPDVPLPSREGHSILAGGEENIKIKQEEDLEDEVDVYSIPEMYHQNAPLSNTLKNAMTSYSALSISSDKTATEKDDDDQSYYSTDSDGLPQIRDATEANITTEDEGAPTPRAQSPVSTESVLNNTSSQRMSLPQFASMLGEDDFGLSFQPYLTPSPPLAEEPTKSSISSLPAVVSRAIERPVTPEAQLDPPRFPGYGYNEPEEPKTPDSVIRHSIASPQLPESPSIPEPDATIKASGGKLKTRPSLTRADVRAMAETRRRISDRHQDVVPSPDSDQAPQEDDAERASLNGSQEVGDQNKQVKRKSSLIQLDVPVEELDEGLSIGLDKEFDRVIEAQKVAFNLSLQSSQLPGAYNKDRDPSSSMKIYANISQRKQKGYLMRHNTKMVVASSASHESATEPSADPTAPELQHARGTRSAGNSPRKTSSTQTWTTEPWNGKIRRKSIRQSFGSPQKPSVTGPAPPLPGQASNVQSGLDSVAENEAVQTSEDFEDGVERGRLFVKVVGVKALDLPLPKNERSYFSLTLDNGLHCVTTAWLELGKYAPIGQEFELVVLNDLEFQLTLQTKLEEPKVVPKKTIEPPTKPVKTPKASTFSRVFTSPKKRKELELKQQEEAQRASRQKQLDAQVNARPVELTAWDLLHNLVAKDGSFARSYVCLKDHESQSYGRPYTVDIPCFNEWAVEEIRTVGSARSGRAQNVPTMQRKAPYKIGHLELQLMFVPKPKEARDEDMPKSMNAAIREIQEAESRSEKSWEGNLSQQGGDCPYWRRRFFRLEGSKLTAYHEATRQPRATINLAKASKLIDDKSSLTKKEVTGKGGARRRSAFAAEEEGYMFVEEGFRIRFANGETIDFYADSAEEKEGWMNALVDVVGKEAKQSSSWTGMVLAKHRANAQRAARAEQGQMTSPSSGMRSAPPTPGARQSSQQQQQQQRPSSRQQQRPNSQQQPRHAPPVETRPSSGGNAPPSVQKDNRQMTAEARRAKSRSMIF